MSWTPDGQGSFDVAVHGPRDKRNRFVAKETYAWPEPLGSAAAPHYDPWADLESWKACQAKREFGLEFQ